MLGLFQRPKLAAQFVPAHAHTDEFTRAMELVGALTLRNDGSEAQVSEVEMVLIAGFRRIPLDVPAAWRSAVLTSGGEKHGDVSWSLILDAPLRAEKGELYVSLQDQKRKKWEWRLPFAFERR